MGARGQHLSRPVVDGACGIEHSLEAVPAFNRGPWKLERHHVRMIRVVQVVAKPDRGRADERAEILLEPFPHEPRFAYRRQPHHERLQHRGGRTRLLPGRGDHSGAWPRSCSG